MKTKFQMAVNPVPDADIYGNIRNLFRKRHRSVEELAEYIGVEPNEARGWLEGECEMPPSYLVPVGEFLGVSVTALLLPDTRFDEDGFVMDRRPMLRMRQYLRLAQEMLFDKRFQRVCADMGHVKQENPALGLMKDAKRSNAYARGEVEMSELSARELSIAKMDDEAYDALLALVDGQSRNTFCDCPSVEMDLIDLYQHVVRSAADAQSLRALCVQEQMSHIEENRAMCLAPEEDWTVPLIASGWHPSELDFDEEPDDDFSLEDDEADFDDGSGEDEAPVDDAGK